MTESSSTHSRRRVGRRTLDYGSEHHAGRLTTTAGDPSRTRPSATLATSGPVTSASLRQLGRHLDCDEGHVSLRRPRGTWREDTGVSRVHATRRIVTDDNATLRLAGKGNGTRGCRGDPGVSVLAVTWRQVTRDRGHTEARAPSAGEAVEVRPRSGSGSP